MPVVRDLECCEHRGGESGAPAINSIYESLARGVVLLADILLLKKLKQKRIIPQVVQINFFLNSLYKIRGTIIVFFNIKTKKNMYITKDLQTPLESLN